MYSTASPPPKKEGAKSITPSGIKGGENRQPYGNACLYSTRSFQWAQHQNRKAAGFPAAFCAERRRFEEDISNPCRRHTETILYSLFTIHFFHPKLCEGEKPRHTPSVPGIARESPPQAEPGRRSRAQWEMMPGTCAHGEGLIESESGRCLAVCRFL